MTAKVTMIELFSGIGAQERALRQLNIPYEVIATCDLDKDAVLSYASMRCNFEEEFKNYNFPSTERMIEELQTKGVGYDFQKGKHSITSRTSVEKLKQYYLADKLSKNLGDISRLESLPYADLVTYSYPCTDISSAGLGEGMTIKCDKCNHSWPIDFSTPTKDIKCPNCGNTQIKSTRSGLLGEVQRLLYISYKENTLPKYLLLENVKNLVGKKFKPQFNSWIKWLDGIGYNTYYQVLNAKHYGIPQNRERVFAVSVRKDVDDGTFKFPETIPLTTRLKDVLEKYVDEKYYLPDERIQKILNSTFMQEKKYIQIEDEIKVIGNYMPSGHDASRVVDVGGIAPTVKENHGTVTAIVEPFIVASRGRNPENPSDRTVGVPTVQRLEPNTSGTTNTITTVQKDNYVVESIIVDDIYNNREPRFYTEAAPTLRSERSGLKVTESTQERFFRQAWETVENNECDIGDSIDAFNKKINKSGVSPTITTRPEGFKTAILPIVSSNKPFVKWRIRKLTPKECWRLMSFDDMDHDRAAQYVSASALYKQAGNSICTCCLVAIFNSLLLGDSSTNYKDKLVKYDV